MELAFADRNFRDLCMNDSKAREELGDAVAEKLKTRLADFSAVHVVSDLFSLPGGTHELAGDRQGCMATNLVMGRFLVFRSGQLKEPKLPAGRIDWSRVRRIQLLGVEHGND